jgi:hypothetical protein
MNGKGSCESCGQRIQNTVFDKCMFCGVALPEHQQFTEAEKEEVLAQQKQAELDSYKMRESNKLNLSGSSDFGFGLDFGSSDSGGTCD